MLLYHDRGETIIHPMASLYAESTQDEICDLLSNSLAVYMFYQHKFQAIDFSST
jgi:hypothetical protein